ncbi:MAG: type III-A CRISPR-associated protein Csm2 [Nitrospirae bacterium]|nr:MAG: type III-A CRISPR-associated protein Csm2 [Nitrospirota bacterium]
MAYPNRNQRPHQGRGGQAAPKRLPEAQSQPRPYRTEAGNLDPFWVNQKAEEEAQAFAALPPTQLRRFFDEVKGLKRQIDLLTSQEKGEARLEPEAAWGRVHPQFAMLKSKVVYAAGRLGKNMPTAFVQFVVNHVGWVRTHQDFEDFLVHFEAVVGFHRFLTTAKG